MKKQISIILCSFLLLGCSSTTSSSKKSSVQVTSTPSATVTPTEETSMREKFKEAMDTYVEFFEQYAEFMKSYDANDTSMLSEYTEFLQKYNETMQKFEELGNEEMNDEEMSYYIDTNAKIQKLLLQIQ